MALRAVVTSDWHLGAMKNVLDDPLAWQMRELHKPFKYALHNGIPNVFIPGDVSDVPVLDQAAFMALVHLLLVYDGQLNIYVMIGNHDVADRVSSSLDLLSFLATAGLFKTVRVIKSSLHEVIDGVEVCFLAWPDPKVKSKKRPPLVLCHVETPGALGDNGLPLKTKDEHIVRVPGDFVVSGHIHQYQYLAKKRWIYCGDPFQKNFGESLPKGFVDLTAWYKDGALKVKHEHINSSPEFELRVVRISSESEIDSLPPQTNIRLKLIVDKQSGVVLPPDLTTRFPNVVSINGTNAVGRGSIEVLKSQTSDMPTFTPKTGLSKYLKATGLNREARRIALSKVDEAMKALSDVAP